MRRSLRARITLAASLTTIAVVLLCGWFYFIYARDLLVARTSETLQGVAAIVASDLPLERLQSYLATEQAGNPDLTARDILLARLQDVADRAGVEDLYLVDRRNRVLLDSRHRLPFGEEDFALSLADPAVERAWASRAPVSAPLFSRPGLGYRLAAFAPVIASDGRPLALVGAEGALPGLAIADALRQRYFWILAVGVLLSFVGALAVSSTILRPVGRLVRAIDVSDASGYPPRIPETGSDEIGFLTRQFNRLIDDLRSKDDALRSLYGREKARAELVLASVPTGVVGVDAEGAIRLWNKAVAVILEVGEEEVLGRLPASLRLPDPMKEALEHARAGGFAAPAESRWRTARGRERRLEISAVPYRDDSGEPLGAVAVVTDVTERARLEEELRIRERLAALGEMSAGIAHEVRNPLTAMEGFAGLLGRRLRDPGEQELLDGLRREITALNGIVTTFSRFARSPLLRRRPIELRALLEDLLPYFEGRGIALEVELNGIPPLNVDPDEMRTVLANLLRNAVEAQPNGGSVRVEAAYDAVRRVHAVRVQDGGPGVPPEIAEKIFNPFFSTKPEGTGMGLALVHRIVTAHGGRVRLLDGEAGGTTFELELPADTPASDGI